MVCPHSRLHSCKSDLSFIGLSKTRMIQLTIQIVVLRGSKTVQVLRETMED